MGLSNNQKNKIRELLSKKIKNKLEKYGRETVSMPFLARIIQDNEKVAAYSFIHSMATTLDMSIYEDISVIIAFKTAEEAFRNYGIGGVISKKQKIVISDIVSKLRNKKSVKSFGRKRRIPKVRQYCGFLYEKRGQRILF